MENMVHKEITVSTDYLLNGGPDITQDNRKKTMTGYSYLYNAQNIKMLHTGI